MRRGAVGVFAAAAMLGAAAVAAANQKCDLTKIVEFPITMNGLRPTVAAKINGRDAQFALDSGAFYSMLSAASAAEFGLKSNPLYNFKVIGIGGSTNTAVAVVKEFTIAGITLKDVEFLVGGSEIGNANAGLLGQNFLERFDVEYDLGHGAIRLWRSEHCDNSMLAYWATAGQAFSVMPINKIDPRDAHTVGSGYLNDQKIRIVFDTGAITSMLGGRAAALAGVKPDSPGVTPAGYWRGIGQGMVKTYIGRFASFKVGDGEEIKNAKLRFMEGDTPEGGMLLGADFFISHRIFVANHEHKLFLTYNGGPVFDLRPGKPALAATDTAASDQAPTPDSAASSAAATPPESGTGSEAAASAPPVNADELARLGSALAARREFAAALADLSQAVAASPDEPEYRLERAQAYWGNGQSDLALGDLDRAIELKPDFVAAYRVRAELKLGRHDEPGAIADLEAIDRLAAPQSDARYELAQSYERLSRFPAAIAQYTLWIKYHPVDARLVNALARRCWGNAVLNQNTSAALDDCNEARRRADANNPQNLDILVDRALVRLRLGDYDKAIGDASQAIKQRPKDARALYLRAVAEARKNKPTESAEDLAEATRLAPKLPEWYARFGITP